MRLRKLAGLLFGCVVIVHASGFVNSSGIPNVVSTVTFEAPTFGLGTTITTQYIGQGVFFAPGVAYTSFSGFIGLSGFGISNTFGGGPFVFVNPFSILFASPRTAAAFNFAANTDITTFTALLNGCPVESFSHATTLPSGAQNPATIFVGFTGIVFDEIRIFRPEPAIAFSQLAVVDNIQLGPTATLVAGAANHSVHGHVNTGSPGHFTGIANHQHHGDHGHTVAVSCPPHFGPHDFFFDLTPDAGQEITASPNFVAALNQDNSPNGDPAPGERTLRARRGSVVQLFGSARGLYLDDADTQPVATETGGFTPPASGSPLYYTTSVPELRIGGLAARVQFSGLAPGLTATWQINFVVPEDAPGGKLPVNVFYEGRLLTSIDISVE